MVNVLGVFRGKNSRIAHKCKKLIKKLWLELNTEKNKRNSLIRQSCKDIAKLLKAGRHYRAFIVAEQLYKDMCIECAYHRLDHLCAHIYSHLHCISKKCAVPTEVAKAMASLIFASSRCDGLHQLQMLQNLFAVRYGCEFVRKNIQLLPGNLVDDEIKENLCIESVPEAVIHRLMSTIADDYCIESRPWETQMKCSELECDSETQMKCSESECDSESDCDSLVSYSSESDDSSSSSSIQIEDGHLRISRKIMGWY